MTKLSQKFIAILITCGLLFALQAPAFSHAKTIFAEEIAADFTSQKSDDCCDEELKLGNLSENKIFISAEKLKIISLAEKKQTNDFFLLVPTSPPNA